MNGDDGFFKQILSLLSFSLSVLCQVCAEPQDVFQALSGNCSPKVKKRLKFSCKT